MSDQPTQYIEQKDTATLVVGMLALRSVLELVNNALDDVSLVQQKPLVIPCSR